MTNWIISDALILPMDGGPRSFSGYVRVEGETIAELGAGPAPRNSGGEGVIDGSGCVLMPGLVNAHTHLYQVLLRAVW